MLLELLQIHQQNLQQFQLFELQLAEIHKVFPTTLNSISTLRHLDLSYTSLTELNPTMLGKNEYLNDLILHDSRITSIHDCAFCGFTNLTKLHLYMSRNLSFIHVNAFGYAKNGKIVTKLKYFSVEHCNLTAISEKLLNWPNVNEIRITGNSFNCSCETAWLIDDIFNPTHSMNLKKISLYYGDTPLQCKSAYIYKNVPFALLNPNYCN